jgi:hypothetical protein
MLKCKKPVYADCRRGRRENGTISIRRHGQEGKGNISVTIEEFAEIVDDQKDIKNIYSLT